MYESLKAWALYILQVPSQAPEEPAGAHESVQVFRASPKYLTYLLIPYAIGIVFASLMLFGLTMIPAVLLVKKGLTWLSILILGVEVVLVAIKATLFYVATRLNYELRWYIVTDRSLRIREGVFEMREVTLTFANVQNINITQGPLQRYFGISDLIVETAGGGTGAQPHGGMMVLGHQGVLRGIDNAAAVREQIQNLLRAYRAAGLGDPDDKQAAPAVVEAAAPGGDEWVAALREVREESKLLRVTVGA